LALFQFLEEIGKGKRANSFLFFGDEGNAITRDLLLMAFPISKEL
jgi:hypothetical protein